MALSRVRLIMSALGGANISLRDLNSTLLVRKTQIAGSTHKSMVTHLKLAIPYATIKVKQMSSRIYIQ